MSRRIVHVIGTGTIVDNDADNDGVCDGDELAGCQDTTACNYDSTATDDGSCTYPIDLYGVDFNESINLWFRYLFGVISICYVTN